MTKRELLGYVARTGGADAYNVADRFGVSPYPTAGMALLRLRRQGLVTRERIDGGFWYFLSERGAARLNYWRD